MTDEELSVIERACEEADRISSEIQLEGPKMPLRTTDTRMRLHQIQCMLWTRALLAEVRRLRGERDELFVRLSGVTSKYDEEQAAEAEREACAEIAEDHARRFETDEQGYCDRARSMDAREIASAIRARGKLSFHPARKGK